MTHELPTYLTMTDRELLAECDVDTYRAGGPGGQKRNKIESAVRIRHRPTGVAAIAEDSRSQLENRPRALKRLRMKLALSQRVAMAPATFEPGEHLGDVIGRNRRFHIGQRDARYPRVVQVVLDVLAAVEARVGEAATLIGVSTGHLTGFLRDDPKLWTEANALRKQFGHKPLR